ncbi:hypothetical protein J2Z44_001757 [Clostridium punense]|uniref:Uncharacterized protein n=1 Tax=Clostridium punense TaxID=1054297 RepID=A0ABS4K4A1_9CLOT|nr:MULTISPECIES: hypothetical protein [Clostridium]EQB90209.1 hypothetical protein M918_01640 [Clostridium sp. BL8]MBP2021961.1 hypothetical protein [Clostridium punense]
MLVYTLKLKKFKLTEDLINEVRKNGAGLMPALVDIWIYLV